MKRLLLASAALLAMTVAGNAAVVASLGINPNSSTGDFDAPATSASGPFQDDYTFTLDGGPQFITFASATNVYTGPLDFITNFTGQLFNDDTDTAIGPLVVAAACPEGGADFCQVLNGRALLDEGNYFLRISGIGGGSSGYGGDLTTIAVPGPLAGAGLIPFLGLLGFAAWRRRKSA